MVLGSDAAFGSLGIRCANSALGAVDDLEQGCSQRSPGGRLQLGSSWSRRLGAVALDDDIRSVGCRAAKGTDVGDVTRVTPSGVEPTGEVHSSLLRCCMWFFDVDSPGGCAEGAANLMGGRPLDA
jgi:hypothetical protein